MLPQSNPVPFVNIPLVPVSARPGSKSFTLTVNGTGFAPTAVVNWNGVALPTIAISSSQLQAVVSASHVAKASTASVTVVNPTPGGGKSDVIYFPIRKPLPTVALSSSAKFNFQGPVLAVGDFNNDGKLDVLTSDISGIGIDVFLGNGDGSFKPPVHNAGWGGTLAGDFNEDGKLDIVSIAYMAGILNFTFYRGNGDGTLSLSGPSVFPTGFAKAADLNGDGHLDVVTVQNFASQTVVDVCFGDGTGNFSSSSCSQVNAVPSVAAGDIAFGDFNRDGKLDFAVALGSVLNVFLNTGTGFAMNQYSSNLVGFTLAAADLNGDGKIDLITTGGGIFLGNGDGTFLAPHVFNVGVGTPSAIVLGDLNGDGHLDMEIDGLGPNIILGNGDGTFQNPLNYYPSILTNYPILADFNNDGKLDLLGAFQTTVTFTPFTLGFGTQGVGSTSLPQTVQLTNIDTAALAITSLKASAEFAQTNNCGSSVPAGATCKVQVTFTPTSKGVVSGSLNVADHAAGSPQSIILSGTGVQNSVSLLPSTLSFPAQLAGTVSPQQTVTLTNTGGTTVTISSVAVTGVFQQTNNCPASLGVGTACQIRVVFAPTSAVKSTGTLSVTDSAPSSPQTVVLSGTGTVVQLSPIGVNFGSQKVGTTSLPVTVTLTNTGVSVLSISQVAIVGTNPLDFVQTNTCGSSVPAHGTCTIKVKFKPKATGSRSGAVSITDVDGASPQMVPMVGTGT